MSLGNNCELPPLVDSLPFLPGFTVAFSEAGQPDLRLHELVVVAVNSRNRQTVAIAKYLFMMDVV